MEKNGDAHCEAQCGRPVVEAHGMSERRACTIIGADRSSVRYRPHSSLGYLTPAAFALTSPPQRASTARNLKSPAPMPVANGAGAHNSQTTIPVAAGGATEVRSRPMTPQVLLNDPHLLRPAAVPTGVVERKDLELRADRHTSGTSPS